ncbi:hypothetical protein MVEN_00297900 [Mycena venus]|uniref:Uncharacterized protein n=1 Tax=Mycena venus TaxID=2733690 RepID=A0A8H6Z020_9AGAR|nr:hypothetical protein MVEN_00297900 [Mycena venus]
MQRIPFLAIMRINLFMFALVLCLGTAIARPIARSDEMGLSLFDDDLTPGDAVLDVHAPNNDFTNPDDDEEDAILDVRAPPKKAAASKKTPAAKKVASPKAPVAKKVSTPKAPVTKKPTAKKTSASPTAAKKKTTAPPAAKKKTSTPPVAKKTTAPAKTTTGKTTTPAGKKTTGKTTTPPGKKTTGKTTTGKKTTGKITPPSNQTTSKTTSAGCPVKRKRGVTGLVRRTEQNLKIGETSVVVTEVKTAGRNSRIFTTDFGFGGKADVIIKCPTGSKSDFDKEVENTKKVDASGVFPVKLFVDSGVGILDCDQTQPLNCLVLTDLTKHGFTELSKAAQAKGKGAGCSKLMDNALGASEKNIIQLASKKIGHGDLDTTNTFTNADGSDTIFIDWADLDDPDSSGGVGTLLNVVQTTFGAEKERLC